MNLVGHLNLQWDYLPDGRPREDHEAAVRSGLRKEFADLGELLEEVLLLSRFQFPGKRLSLFLEQVQVSRRAALQGGILGARARIRCHYGRGKFIQGLNQSL